MSILSTKILLAVDGSKEAYLSARAAADIAHLSGSELHLVHVEEHPPHLLADYGPFVYTDTGAIQTVVGRAERQAREVLNKQVARVKDIGGTISQSYFRQRYPDQEIVRLAEEIGAGLIVIGSRGLGGMRRALMGSVSDSLVRHAHWAVLVVRA